VRAHVHLFEVNRALKFDRAVTFGLRLECPSGTGVRVRAVGGLEENMMGEG